MLLLKILLADGTAAVVDAVDASANGDHAAVAVADVDVAAGRC